MDPNGGKGGIIDKFSTSRRRLKENIAQKTGKEAADNSEFEERWQRVSELREKVCFIMFGCCFFKDLIVASVVAHA